MIVASIRLAFALVCVGISLILSAYWFGITPDPNEETTQHRKKQCESISLYAVSNIRKEQWRELESTLKQLVTRNGDLVSIGVVSATGSLKVDTGHHQTHCERASEENPSAVLVKVPITLNGREWGSIEFCYRGSETSAFWQFFQDPRYRLVIFFACGGICAYSLFIARVMGVFRSTQVVPDRVREALDTLADGLLVLDEKCRIVLANSAFSTAVDATSAQLNNMLIDDLNWKCREDDALVLPWHHCLQHNEQKTEVMLRLANTDGRERIFSVNASPLGTESRRGVLATFRDVTHIEEHRIELERMLLKLRSSRDEISRKNRELEILATQDALTGCLNRRAFFERFERLWQSARLNQTPLACVMIDNDHFKRVNDSYGHHTGDEVLRAVAKTIRSLFSDQDLVGRYGGEEFCVVLPGRTLQEAIAEAETIRIAISDLRLRDPQTLRLTASLGVSEIGLDAVDPQGMINQADLSLYVAKRSGRNRVVQYEASFENMNVDVTKDRSIDNAELPESTIPFHAVTALLSALAYRDSATAEHGRRVADLCVKAADGVFDLRQTFVLEIAALLHDIGKIGIPDQVLHKKGPLTAAEWQLMNSQNQMGIDILDGAFNHELLVDIVRTHKAYYGGRPSHPDLPIGDEIPMLARLLAIADTYDSICSDRCYRKGASHEEAIEELRRCAGVQFDPQLVEHFANRIAGTDVAGDRSLHSPIPKQVAIQIGSQIERLADAVDRRDMDHLRLIASRLTKMATQNQVDSIATAANKLEQSIRGDEEAEWMNLLQQTNYLLECCRATQDIFITPNTE
jgi:diguanylate cyclase (GGDEF)-like protein/PAS domain S-box-containing protein